jgi:hypothetical protein
MNQSNRQIYSSLYISFIVSVLIISIVALTAEFLPEISAKPLVITALLMIIGLCITDFLKIRKTGGR